MDSRPPGKDTSTPGVKRHPSDEEEQPLPPEQGSRFRSAVGSLIYLSTDRWGVLYATKALARHMQQPRIADWHDLTRVARYLWGTKGWVVVLKKDPEANPEELVIECDADWAGAFGDRSLCVHACISVLYS